MSLKNVLIIVSDIEKAKKFYMEVFSLQPILDMTTNVMLTQGLVLQDKASFESNMGRDVILKSNSCLLYFEENNLKNFAEKLNRLYPDIEYVNEYYENEQYSLLRFYDLDFNLIEVREYKK